MALLPLLHPFLMALLPPLLLLSYVREQILPEETFSSFLFLQAFALILLAICSCLFHDRKRGSIAASAFIVGTFSFRIWDALWNGIFHTTPLAVNLLVYYALQILLIKAFLGGKWVWRGKPVSINFDRVGVAITAVALLLILLNGIPLFAYYIEQNKQADMLRSDMALQFAHVKLDASGQRPDIYYIILDGYASPQTMVEMFPDAPEGRLLGVMKHFNFFIADRAASNYDRTEFSLASSLNMQYLDATVANGNRPSPGVFMRLVGDNQFVRLIKDCGYKFVLVSSGAFGTDSIFTADQNLSIGAMNHFARALACLTPLCRTEDYLAILSTSMAQIRLAPGKFIEKLSSEKVTGPRFILIHTDLPHTPYIFNHTGGFLRPPPDLIPNWNPREAYWQQWYFAQETVSRWVVNLCNSTKGEAVIIVQSDHGPGMREHGMTDSDWYNERMRIFNAYYFPGKKSARPFSEPYPSVSPVNSLRIVLNRYFAAGLPLLPDRAHCPADSSKAFDWVDVTNELHFKKQDQ